MDCAVHALFCAAAGWCAYRVGTFARRSVVPRLVPFERDPTPAFHAMRAAVAVLSVAVALALFLAAGKNSR